MKKTKIKKLIALMTAVFLTLNQLSAAPHAWASQPAEVKIPSPGFQLDLPPDLGTIQSLVSGSGRTVIHIQTAHGNYEAQKKIQAILHYLKDTYGFKLLLLEGSAFKLKPELLRLLPDRMDLTKTVMDDLTKQALVKGPELFLMEEPQAEAYGIETLKDYVSNGDSFRSVLIQQEKSQAFVQSMESQIDRLASTYLDKDLRDFLKELDRFEANRQSLFDWLAILKNKAKECLKIDLTDPVQQMDWPMLLRFFKLKESEVKINQDIFAKERPGFLKTIRRISKGDFDQIEKLLSGPFNDHQLPDPETGLLFERMVSALPPDFHYSSFPNTEYVIGRLILQSELKGGRLVNEAEVIANKISEKLAGSNEAKELLGLLKDLRLLKKFFALELTPRDYEEILRREQSLRPAVLIQHFLDLNKGNRVKNVAFTHLTEIDSLFQKAMEFYRGAKNRDHSMLRNVELRLKELGSEKTVIVTGGFHSEPFKEYFQSQGYSYALITPKLTAIEGREAYLHTIMDYQIKGVSSSTYETAPFIPTPRSELRQLGFDSDKIKPLIFERVSKIISAEPNRDFLEHEFQNSLYVRQFSQNGSSRSEVRVETAQTSSGSSRPTQSELTRQEIEGLITPLAGRMKPRKNFFRSLRRLIDKSRVTYQAIVDSVSPEIVAERGKGHAGMVNKWFENESISWRYALSVAEFFLGKAYPGESSEKLLALMVGEADLDTDLLKLIFPYGSSEGKPVVRPKPGVSVESKASIAAPEKFTLSKAQKLILPLKKGMNPKRNFLDNLEKIMEAKSVTRQELADYVSLHIVKERGKKERGKAHAGMVSHWFRRGVISFESALKASHYILSDFYPGTSEVDLLSVLTGKKGLSREMLEAMFKKAVYPLEKPPELPERLLQEWILPLQIHFTPEEARLHFFNNFERISNGVYGYYRINQQQLADSVSPHLPKGHSGMVTHWFEFKAISRENALRVAEFYLSESYPNESSEKLLARLTGNPKLRPDSLAEIFPREPGRKGGQGTQRSEVRENNEPSAEVEVSWLTDPEKITDWSSIKPSQKRFLIRLLLDSLDASPNDLIERPEVISTTPIKLIGGKSLRTFYEYYDGQRKIQGLPYSTVEAILYDSNFPRFQGRKEVERYRELDQEIDPEQRRLLTQISQEIGLDHWLNLFQSNQAALFYLLIKSYPQEFKPEDESKQRSLLALLSEKFMERKQQEAEAFTFNNLIAMEPVIEKFWSEETKEILLAQIRARLRNFLVAQAREQNGTSVAYKTLDIAQKWFGQELKRKKLPKAVKEIYQALQDYYLEIQAADYQKHVNLTDKSRKPVYLKLHQLEAIHFALKNGRVIFGDEMGLGKTAQTLALLQAAGAERVLVVAPKSLLKVWETEIKKWLGKQERVAVIEGIGDLRLQNLKTAVKTARFIVINYEALRMKDPEKPSKIVEILNDWNPDYKIGDEIHRLRNPQTHEAKGFTHVKANRVLGLSGTILVNHWKELYLALHEVDPQAFPSRAKFLKEYSEDPLSFVQMNIRLQGRYLLRRTKEDVAIDLPARNQMEPVQIILDPEQQEAYSAELKAYDEALAGNHGHMESAGREGKKRRKLSDIEILARREKMRQAAVDLDLYYGTKGAFQYPPGAKLREALNLTKEIITKGEKVVLFVRNRRVIEKLHDLLTKEFGEEAVSFIRGGVSLGERFRRVAHFNADPKNKIFLSTDVGAEGLNGLEAANHVIFIDLDWTKAMREQKIGRLHREGQTRPVYIHDLVAPGTIDDETLGILRRKETVFDQVVNGSLQLNKDARTVQRYDRRIRQQSEMEKAREELVPPYYYAGRGQMEESKAAWEKAIESYSKNVTHMASFYADIAFYLHLLELHKSGEIDLKKIKKMVLAPAGPYTEYQALASLEEIFLKKSKIKIRDWRVIGIDWLREMMDRGADDLVPLNLRPWKSLVKNLVQEELTAKELGIESNEGGEVLFDSSEIWSWPVEFKTQDVPYPLWVLAQLVRNMKKGDYIRLWAHNKVLSKKAKENLGKYFGLELLHPEIDYLDVEGVPESIRAKIRRSGFILARKKRDIQMTPSYLKSIPQNAIDFLEESRPTNRLATKLVHADTTRNGSLHLGNLDLEDVTVIGLGERPLRQDKVTQKDKKLKGLASQFQELLRGPPRSDTEEAMNRLIQQMRRMATENYLKKRVQQLRYNLNQRPDWKSLETYLEGAIAELEKGPIPQAPKTQTRQVSEERKGKERSNKPTRTPKEPVEKTVSKTILTGPSFYSLFQEGNDEEKPASLLHLFAHRGYSFVISPTPVREGLRYEEGKFKVDPYLAGTLSAKALSFFLDMKAYDFVPLLFPDKKKPDSEQAGVEVLQDYFREIQDQNRDLELLQKLDPDQTDLFYFVLDLRRAAEGARSEIRLDTHVSRQQELFGTGRSEMRAAEKGSKAAPQGVEEVKQLLHEALAGLSPKKEKPVEKPPATETWTRPKDEDPDVEKIKLLLDRIPTAGSVEMPNWGPSFRDRVFEKYFVHSVYRLHRREPWDKLDPSFWHEFYDPLLEILVNPASSARAQKLARRILLTLTPTMSDVILKTPVIITDAEQAAIENERKYWEFDQNQGMHFTHTMMNEKGETAVSEEFKESLKTGIYRGIHIPVSRWPALLKGYMDRYQYLDVLEPYLKEDFIKKFPNLDARKKGKSRGYSPLTTDDISIRVENKAIPRDGEPFSYLEVAVVLTKDPRISIARLGMDFDPENLSGQWYVDWTKNAFPRLLIKSSFQLHRKNFDAEIRVDPGLEGQSFKLTEGGEALIDTGRSPRYWLLPNPMDPRFILIFSAYQTSSAYKYWHRSKSPKAFIDAMALTSSNHLGGPFYEISPEGYDVRLDSAIFHLNKDGSIQVRAAPAEEPENQNRRSELRLDTHVSRQQELFGTGRSELRTSSGKSQIDPEQVVAIKNSLAEAVAGLKKTEKPGEIQSRRIPELKVNKAKVFEILGQFSIKPDDVKRPDFWQFARGQVLQGLPEDSFSAWQSYHGPLLDVLKNPKASYEAKEFVARLYQALLPELSAREFADRIDRILYLELGETITREKEILKFERRFFESKGRLDTPLVSLTRWKDQAAEWGISAKMSGVRLAYILAQKNPLQPFTKLAAKELILDFRKHYGRRFKDLLSKGRLKLTVENRDNESGTEILIRYKSPETPHGIKHPYPLARLGKIDDPWRLQAGWQIPQWAYDMPNPYKRERPWGAYKKTQARILPEKPGSYWVIPSVHFEGNAPVLIDRTRADKPYDRKDSLLLIPHEKYPNIIEIFRLNNNRNPEEFRRWEQQPATFLDLEEPYLDLGQVDDIGFQVLPGKEILVLPGEGSENFKIFGASFTPEEQFKKQETVSRSELRTNLKTKIVTEVERIKKTLFAELSALQKNNKQEIEAAKKEEKEGLQQIIRILKKIKISPNEYQDFFQAVNANDESGIREYAPRFSREVRDKYFQSDDAAKLTAPSVNLQKQFLQPLRQIWRSSRSKSAKLIAKYILLALAPSHAESILNMKSRFEDFMEALQREKSFWRAETQGLFKPVYNWEEEFRADFPSLRNRSLSLVGSQWEMPPEVMAAYLAREPKPFKLDQASEEELISSFFLKYGRRFKNVNPARFRIDIFRTDFGKAAEITLVYQNGEKDEIPIAKLGTGFSPGDIQGEWYLLAGASEKIPRPSVDWNLKKFMDWETSLENFLLLILENPNINVYAFTLSDLVSQNLEESAARKQLKKAKSKYYLQQISIKTGDKSVKGYGLTRRGGEYIEGFEEGLKGQTPLVEETMNVMAGWFRISSDKFLDKNYLGFTKLARLKYIFGKLVQLGYLIETGDFSREYEFTPRGDGFIAGFHKRSKYVRPINVEGARAFLALFKGKKLPERFIIREANEVMQRKPDFKNFDFSTFADGWIKHDFIENTGDRRLIQNRPYIVYQLTPFGKKILQELPGAIAQDDLGFYSRLRSEMRSKKKEPVNPRVSQIKEELVRQMAELKKVSHHRQIDFTGGSSTDSALQNLQQYLTILNGRDVTEEMIGKQDPNLFKFREAWLQGKNPRIQQVLNTMGEHVVYVNPKTPRAWEPGVKISHLPVWWGMDWFMRERDSPARNIAIRLDSDFLNIRGAGTILRSFPIYLQSSGDMSHWFQFGQLEGPAVREMIRGLRLQEFALKVLGKPLEIAMPLKIVEVDQIPYQGKPYTIQEYFLKYAKAHGEEETKMDLQKYFQESYPRYTQEFMKDWSLERTIQELVNDRWLAQLQIWQPSDIRSNIKWERLANDAGQDFKEFQNYYQDLFSAYGEKYQEIRASQGAFITAADIQRIYEQNKSASNRMLKKAAIQLGQVIGIAIGVGALLEDALQPHHLVGFSWANDFDDTTVPDRVQMDFSIRKGVQERIEHSAWEMIDHAIYALRAFSEFLAPGMDLPAGKEAVQIFAKELRKAYRLTQKKIINPSSEDLLSSAYRQRYQQWRDSGGETAVFDFLDSRLARSELRKKENYFQQLKELSELNDLNDPKREQTVLEMALKDDFPSLRVRAMDALIRLLPQERKTAVVIHLLSLFEKKDIPAERLTELIQRLLVSQKNAGEELLIKVWETLFKYDRSHLHGPIDQGLFQLTKKMKENRREFKRRLLRILTQPLAAYPSNPQNEKEYDAYLAETKSLRQILNRLVEKHVVTVEDFYNYVVSLPAGARPQMIYLLGDVLEGLKESRLAVLDKFLRLADGEKAPESQPLIYLSPEKPAWQMTPDFSIQLFEGRLRSVPYPVTRMMPGVLPDAHVLAIFPDARTPGKEPGRVSHVFDVIAYARFYIREINGKKSIVAAEYQNDSYHKYKDSEEVGRYLYEDWPSVMRLSLEYYAGENGIEQIISPIAETIWKRWQTDDGRPGIKGALPYAVYDKHMEEEGYHKEKLKIEWERNSKNKLKWWVKNLIPSDPIAGRLKTLFSRELSKSADWVSAMIEEHPPKIKEKETKEEKEIKIEPAIKAISFKRYTEIKADPRPSPLFSLDSFVARAGMKAEREGWDGVNADALIPYDDSFPWKAEAGMYLSIGVYPFVTHEETKRAITGQPYFMYPYFDLMHPDFFGEKSLREEDKLHKASLFHLMQDLRSHGYVSLSVPVFSSQRDQNRYADWVSEPFVTVKRDPRGLIQSLNIDLEKAESSRSELRVMPREKDVDPRQVREIKGLLLEELGKMGKGTKKEAEKLPPADTELERILEKIGFVLPMWMNHQYSTPRFGSFVRSSFSNVVSIRTAWGSRYKPLLDRLKEGSVPTAHKRLIQWAFAAMVPRLAGMIFSGNIDEGELKREMINEQNLAYFEEGEINSRNRISDPEVDLLVWTGYAGRWELPIKTDIARIAAMNARSRAGIRLTAESKQKLIEDFLSKHGKIFGANHPKPEDLVLLISDDATLDDQGKELKISKFSIASQKNPKRVFAHLGTGYEPGNLQGEWYIDWTKLKFSKETLNLSTMIFHLPDQENDPIRFRTLKMPPKSAIALELEVYGIIGWVLVRNPYDRDKSALIYKYRGSWDVDISSLLPNRNPEGFLDLTIPDNQAVIGGLTFQVTPGKAIQAFKQTIGSKRSEVRLADEIYQNRNIRITIEEPRAYVFPLRFEKDFGAQIFPELGRLFFGENAYAAAAGSRPMAPVLSEKEITALGILRPVLTNASKTERRILDSRSTQNPSELDPWILKTLYDSKLEYKLLHVGPKEEVNRLRSELRNYVQSRYQVDLPSNFQVVRVDSPEFLTAVVQKLVSEKSIPVGIISGDRKLLERVGYRGKLMILRALGDSKSAEIQNATGLLTDAWLLKENLPLEIGIRIHTGADLDLDHQWEALLAALRGRTALLSAA